jgi:hypothetical protein
MLIRVLCSDKSRGFVEDYYLDDLIGRGVVVAFFPQPQMNGSTSKITVYGKKRALHTKGPKEEREPEFYLPCVKRYLLPFPMESII